MNKKIPLRKCVVTNERFPKKELVRIVKTKEGEIFVDETGKANGRGAYINLKKSTIKKAQDRKILNRVFQTEIDEKIFLDLYKLDEEKNS